MRELIPLLLFALSSSLTPGPNNFLVMNSGLRFGIKKSLPHFFGIMIGFPLMLLVITLGFGAVIDQYTWLKHMLKIVGAGYMLFLAWQIYTSKTSLNKKMAARPFSFLQAVLFQWINPKAWIMGIGVVSLFTLSENYMINALLISLLFFVICLPTVGLWLVGGAFLKKFLKEEKHFKWFNTIMAASLVASIGMILFD